jgi:CHAT domain-containing protein
MPWQHMSLRICLAGLLTCVLTVPGAFGQNASAGTSALGQAIEDIKPGLVVETVDRGREAERAGLREGDVLLNWSRGDTHGKFESPFNLDPVEAAEAPLGPVTLEGMRGSEARVWVIGEAMWGLHVRPNLPESLLEAHIQARDLFRAKKFVEAADGWRARANQSHEPSFSWLASWFLVQAGDALSGGRSFAKAADTYREAFLQAESAGPLVQAQLLRARALVLHSVGNLTAAEDAFAMALERTRNIAAPDSLLLARAFTDLAWVMVGSTTGYDGEAPARVRSLLSQALAIEEQRSPHGLEKAKTLYVWAGILPPTGNLARQEEHLQEALRILERLAPDSPDLADALVYLGGLVEERGMMQEARSYWQRAAHIVDELDLDLPDPYINLGENAYWLGDLGLAETYYRRSLEIGQRSPRLRGVAHSLCGLGMVADMRGDLAKAEKWYRQALIFVQGHTPSSYFLTNVWSYLGGVASQRGDLVQAEAFHKRALDAHLRLRPRGDGTSALFLAQLGVDAFAAGDLKRAGIYHNRALNLRRKIAPESLETAESLRYVAELDRATGHLSLALKHYQAALAIQNSRSPSGASTASTLQDLGNLFHALGDDRKAEEFLRRALDRWNDLAPASSARAETLAALAAILRRERRLDEAAGGYRESILALESQANRWGGGRNLREGFRAKYANYYREYIGLLVTQGKREEALAVLERARARTLLETLTTGHVDVRQGAAPELISKERLLETTLKAKSERRISLLSDKHTDEQIKFIEKEISELTSEYQGIEAQLRSDSPGYTALTQPQPLSAKEIQQQLLDSSTLLLEYSLGEERSYVFAVTPGSLHVFELPPQKKIEKIARQLYTLLTTENHHVSGETEEQRILRLVSAKTAYSETASALSQMILGPVAQQLQNKRLLIVADGALHYVPFAALPEPEDKSATRYIKPEVLVLNHEVVNLPSASVLALLERQASSRRPAPKTVSVLADPVFDRGDIRVKAVPAGAQQNGSGTTWAANKTEDQQSETEQSHSMANLARSATDVGRPNTRNGKLYLPRLQFTRQEADAIVAAAFPGQSLSALDFKASRATAVSPDLANYRIVHFATHAMVNNMHPELSGLVLSLVDEQGKPQNGFLDLQDIYNLTLPADLVVLSACETGLGRRIEGEGLVGLTRGFMYAGASGVAASLWKIDDRATAEFMRRFYRALLGQKMRPAAALRAAQLEMRNHQRWSSPYFWAAFQIQGEWR